MEDGGKGSKAKREVKGARGEGGGEEKERKRGKREGSGRDGRAEMVGGGGERW